MPADDFTVEREDVPGIGQVIRCTRHRGDLFIRVEFAREGDRLVPFYANRWASLTDRQEARAAAEAALDRRSS